MPNPPIEKPGAFYETITFVSIKDMPRPTWPEVLASLEKAAYVNIGDQICLRRVDYFLPKGRGYELRKALSCSMVGKSNQNKNEIFSYTENGYNSAWEYCIQNRDDTQSRIRISKKRTRNRPVVDPTSPIQKIVVMQKDPKTTEPYKDPDYMAWKRDLWSYATEKLTTPRSEREKFSTEDYEKMLFWFWQHSWHWLDVALEFSQSNLEGAYNEAKTKVRKKRS